MEYSTNDLLSEDYAKLQDDLDIFFSFKERFVYPQINSEDVLYFCGHSLGLPSRSVEWLMQQEFKLWSKFGNESLPKMQRNWADALPRMASTLSQMIKVAPHQLNFIHTFETQLKSLLDKYLSKKQNGFILIPSTIPKMELEQLEDYIKHHVSFYNIQLLKVPIPTATHYLSEEDLMDFLQNNKDEIALVYWPLVDGLSGKKYDALEVNQYCNQFEIPVIWNFTYAIGSIDINCQALGIQAACWESHVYLNAGYGAVAGRYDVNYQNKIDIADQQFPLFGMIGLYAALDILDKQHIEEIALKGAKMTDYLIHQLNLLGTHLGMELITPTSEGSHGNQITLYFEVSSDAQGLKEYLKANGIWVEVYQQHYIIIAPNALYNSFVEIQQLFKVLKRTFH